jgi:hypothetical protein
MVTDEEVEAAAEAYRFTREVFLRNLFSERVAHTAGLRAALLAAEAARKPDVVPGLERARDLVRAVVGNDHTDDISWKVGFAMGKVTSARAITAEIDKHRPSPSPEHAVDDDALVRRLDGLPQP